MSKELLIPLLIGLFAINVSADTYRVTITPGETCEILCYSDGDCDDGSPLTVDTCLDPGTCDASCSSIELSQCADGLITAQCECEDTAHSDGYCCADIWRSVCTTQDVDNCVCSTDESCDDGDICTIDTCSNPDSCTAECVHTLSDEPECEIPDCVEGLITEQCVCGVEVHDEGYCCGSSHRPLSAVCSSAADCDDGNDCTTDECQFPDACDATCSNTPIAGCTGPVPSSSPGPGRAEGPDFDGDGIPKDRDCNDFLKFVGECIGCMVCESGHCVEGPECQAAVAGVDSDGDGLSDDKENELGTDADIVDTDADLVSDYQEVEIDNTDPLDNESNLLYVIYENKLTVGEKQTIVVSHPTLGARTTMGVDIIDPNGNITTYYSNKHGLIEIDVTEEGMYIFTVYHLSYKYTGSFFARQKEVPFVPVDVEVVEAALGEEAADYLWYLILLLFSFFALAVFSAFESPLIFKKLPSMSQTEKRMVLVKRLVFVAVYALIPILASKFLGMIIALIIILIQLGILFFIGYFKRKPKAK